MKIDAVLALQKQLFVIQPARHVNRAIGINQCFRGKRETAFQHLFTNHILSRVLQPVSFSGQVASHLLKLDVQYRVVDTSVYTRDNTLCKLFLYANIQLRETQLEGK